jgi:hypothetical protein
MTRRLIPKYWNDFGNGRGRKTARSFDRNEAWNDG